MSPELLIQLAGLVIGQALTAGAIYGALRADVRHLVREVTEAKAHAARAHQRIDQVLQLRSQARR